jgi:deferrochelatase/peroxidase EfeB
MSRIPDEDLRDMQRLILQGFPKRRAARYMLFQISDPKKARNDLGKLLPHVATSDSANRALDEDKNCRISIAFTYAGLKAIGLEEKSGTRKDRKLSKLHNLPLPFREGMNNKYRAQRLGDNPDSWVWGNEGNQSERQIHVLVALFSHVDDTVKQYQSCVAWKLKQDWGDIGGNTLTGLQILKPDLPDAFLREDMTGHFGYRDGISQPYIEGSGTSKKPRGRYAAAHIVKPGEFILGYPNEFLEKIPPVWVDNELDPGYHLQGDRVGRRDFGRNGTYLIFRQLKQRKKTFEAFLTARASEAAQDPMEALKIEPLEAPVKKREVKLDQTLQTVDAKLLPKAESGKKLSYTGEPENKVVFVRKLLENLENHQQKSKYSVQIAYFSDLLEALNPLHDRWKQLKEFVAAKLVGRWRSGAPMVRAGEADNPFLADENDFLFMPEDRYGYRCPIGSHIRRSYPRDSASAEGAPTSPEGLLIKNRRRRLIRRGRPYHTEDADDIGLHFLCLSANIRDQFEFVQETWINNKDFGNSQGEVDPIVGTPPKKAKHKFTAQASPVSREYELPKFVEVVGGSYFFLPSMSALRFLRNLK